MPSGDPYLLEEMPSQKGPHISIVFVPTCMLKTMRELVGREVSFFFREDVVIALMLQNCKL